MKALILSGGKGTRLRPITHTNAKQLLPLANKPILFYAIETIVEAGINDIGIVVGDTHKEIRQAVEDGKAWGAQVTYIQQEAPLGLAHAVKISEPYLGDEAFVMFLGDNLIQGGISALVEDFASRGPHAQILLARVPQPERFGVAELKNGRVICLEEKPEHPKSDYALVGVYMFGPTIFEAVNAIQASRRGELEITDAIQYLIDHDYMVHPHIITGWWKDTGKLEDILEANRIVLQDLEERVEAELDVSSEVHGPVVIEKGARIVGSVIRGPVTIAKDCQIIDSYIGPFTSIGEGTVIRNSEVEHSIILAHCQILDVESRIEDSLIGKNVEIYRAATRPKAYRFMLGDNSRTGIL